MSKIQLDDAIARPEELGARIFICKGFAMLRQCYLVEFVYITGGCPRDIITKKFVAHFGEEIWSSNTKTIAMTLMNPRSCKLCLKG